MGNERIIIYSVLRAASERIELARCVRCKGSNKFCRENTSGRRDDRLSPPPSNSNSRRYVSALYIYIYTYLPTPRSYISWSAAILPAAFSPLSVRVDVRRRGRRGLRGRPCIPLDSGMRYISREKTSSIDNLLEELARVHANFWIIMPRRVHYASYRAPSVASPLFSRPSPSPSPLNPFVSDCLAPAHDETLLQLSTPGRLSSPIALCN